MSVFGFTNRDDASVTVNRVRDICDPTALVIRVEFGQIPCAALFGKDDVRVEKTSTPNGSVVVKLTMK